MYGVQEDRTSACLVSEKKEKRTQTEKKLRRHVGMQVRNDLSSFLPLHYNTLGSNIHSQPFQILIQIHDAPSPLLWSAFNIGRELARFSVIDLLTREIPRYLASQLTGTVCILLFFFLSKLCPIVAKSKP